MIYLNIITEQRTKEFIDEATTIPVNDSRVAPFFQSTPETADGIGYKRGKDANGLPIFKKYAVDADGNFYSHYLATPDVNGIYQSDVDTIALDFEKDLKSKYKSYYLEIVEAELNRLDYDSMSTVKLWEGDDIYGTEAFTILAWYKSIIDKNYAILNAIKPTDGTQPYKYNQAWIDIIPTKDEYLAELPELVA